MEVNPSDLEKQNVPEYEEIEGPSSSQIKNVVDDLATFRYKWHEEIRSTHKHAYSKDFSKTEDVEDTETKAKTLFMKGIELEKDGKFYEAIQFYRRAVQIVPDIEFKLDNVSKPKLRDKIKDNDENDEEGNLSGTENISDDSEDEIIKEGELLAHIQKKVSKGPQLCTMKNEQNATHISLIPVEIILYILRWVVSSDLDLRSLEMFSTVCRGFYLCARDPEIWRLACIRIWGLNCGPTPSVYKTWREMYIDRPRLHFNGCYISKTTYIRPGEDSFQDHLYRPWHLVAYYRFLRFFPEGTVLMLTTPDEPSQCVGLLKNRNARHPILSGYYRLKDDKVTLVIQRQDKKVNYPGFKKTRKKDAQENPEQTFHMELKIASHGRKRHIQLSWMHYSIYTKTKIGGESTCSFDLRSNVFPPFWFSRVKSFTAESESPLS